MGPIPVTDACEWTMTASSNGTKHAVAKPLCNTWRCHLPSKSKSKPWSVWWKHYSTSFPQTAQPTSPLQDSLIFIDVGIEMKSSTSQFKFEDIYTVTIHIHGIDFSIESVPWLALKNYFNRTRNNRLFHDSSAFVNSDETVFVRELFGGCCSKRFKKLR